MEKTELIKRGEDLQNRCLRSHTVTHSHFLTPAERYELEKGLRSDPDCTLLFHGGAADCERSIAFFLPDYLSPEDLVAEDYISALRIEAFFGTPGHRDYLGALLGMGIERDRLGDIRVSGNTAVVFCQPEVLSHIASIEKVGRCGVKTAILPLAEVPDAKRKVKNVRFSVMSPRLDAVTAGMFQLSRTQAARHIEMGEVSLNYAQVLKPDTLVQPGDIISLRGKGKGTLTDAGGMSRKGRTFLNAEIYI